MVVFLFQPIGSKTSQKSFLRRIFYVNSSSGHLNCIGMVMKCTILVFCLVCMTGATKNGAIVYQWEPLCEYNLNKLQWYQYSYSYLIISLFSLLSPSPPSPRTILIHSMVNLCQQSGIKNGICACAQPFFTAEKVVTWPTVIPLSLAFSLVQSLSHGLF